MRDFLKALGLGKEEQKNHGTLFKQLESQLDSLPEEQAKYVTGLAGLLGKVAISDLEICEKERGAIEEILKSQTQLTEDLALKTAQITTELAEELSGIEDHYYTKLVNEVTQKEQRKAIVTAMLEVASINHSISAEEDAAIGAVAHSLLFTRKEYMELRHPFTQHLDVLKDF